MTPDEHYREAERNIGYVYAALVEHEGEEMTPAALEYLEQRLARTIALAQVHATLATIYRSTERLVEK